MTVALAHIGDLRGVLIPADADKDVRYRVGRFLAWHAGDLWAPDLAAYRDALLTEGLSPVTIAAHLSTIRGRYRALLRDPGMRQTLYAQAGAYLRGAGLADDPANRSALVNERERSLRDALDPETAPVKIGTAQDRPDSAQIRLTVAQAGALLRAPGLATLRGLRDTALIAVALCAGLRESELVGLDVADLWQTWGGEPGVLVREGKGQKQRMVPYGELRWARLLADAWLHRANIQTGAVFRGLYRGGRSVRPGRLSVRAVGDVLRSYPVEIGGELRTVRPHDLRRSYASLLCRAGLGLLQVQQNLGHASIATTELYVGPLDPARRAPPAILTFDLAALREVLA